MSDSSNEPQASGIAVIGLAGRFPKSRNAEEFWQHLSQGRELITFFSDEEVEAEGVSPELLKHPSYVKAGSVIEDAEMFDAAFFGYSPREAEMMDPQQRLFLESAWQALEKAGYNPDSYAGRIGVYAGVNTNTYFFFNLYPRAELIESSSIFQTMLGNEDDHLTTRVSYKLNLRGPSLAVQTACSTSLVAVHLACQGLLTGECDMALAGGVSIRAPQRTGYLYQGGGISSPDGHCRAFDAQAQGTVAGSGVGIVVLKRLEDAVADGDSIDAVIKGSAINNDGSLKVGYTAPSVEGQAEVIAEALALAAADPESISYIEAHGTGTPLGDPIEVAALTKVFSAATDRKQFCAIGSVKSNIGHLGAAAGVAGLIKTVLALKHKQIPPSLHFHQPNPKIDFSDSPFYVATELSDWASHQGVRRAGVSSFGIGGTNVHVVVEEAGEQEETSESRRWQLLVMSAKTESGLEEMTDGLAEYLREERGESLADVAYTLQVGRKAFSHRRVVVSEGIKEASRRLQERDPAGLYTRVYEGGDRQIVFMFPGLGDHYANMGEGLYRSERVYREVIDECSDILKPILGLSMNDILYPGDGNKRAETKSDGKPRPRIDLRKMLLADKGAAGEASQPLNQTFLAQPAVFVIEYALARLWMHWGIKPRAMVGYSLGEYVAACLAGVFSLNDALRLVAGRAQMIQELPAGAMLAVPLSEGEVSPLLGGRVCVAAINGPSLSVLSGRPDAVAEIEAELREREIPCRTIPTSHAFHSKMMNPIADSLATLAAQIDLKEPQIPFLSNVTGRWITGAQATSPDYWATHMCETVRFEENLRHLLKEPDRLLLEVGPGQSLGSFALQHPERDYDQVALASMPYSYDRQPDQAFLLTTLGRLWASGAQIDWDGFYSDERRRRIPLPTYPFERRRYWVDPQERIQSVRSKKEPGGRKADLSEWFYVPVWKQSVPRLSPVPGGMKRERSNWLLFADECGLASQLAERLQGMSRSLVMVIPGSGFARLDESLYSIDPADRSDYELLLAELASLNRSPDTIVHLWSVTDSGAEVESDYDPSRQDLGFYSLLNLAQAIGSFTEPVRILAVSNGLHGVTGEEILSPQKSTLLGPCKVIGREYPNISCQSVDVLLPEGDRERGRLIGQILAELEMSLPDPVVAYRGKHRWVETFDPVRVEAEEDAPLRLKPRGVYLITGGLGGIGLSLAEFLAESVEARLILTGRSTFPDRSEWEEWLLDHDEQDEVSRKIRTLMQIEQSGSQVLVVTADVADEEQMREAVALARGRFGKIDGVIHSAGIAGGGMIEVKTREMAASVLESKVQGTLLLDSLFKDEALDFFVLCSSMGAILGGFGEVDYCAGNAFLDSFAQAKASSGATNFVSINWDVWQQVGLAINTAVPSEYRRWREEVVKKGILPREGMEVFRRALGATVPQVVVCAQDFQTLIDQHNAFSASAALKDLEAVHKSRGVHPRPQLGVPYAAPTDELQRSIASIWQELLGIEQVGINDNFFDLGGHSLLGTLIVSRVRESLSLELSLQTLFENPTIAGLTPALLNGGDGRGDADGIEPLLAEMENLSEEEVERLLSEEV